MRDNSLLITKVDSFFITAFAVVSRKNGGHNPGTDGSFRRWNNRKSEQCQNSRNEKEVGKLRCRDNNFVREMTIAIYTGRKH